MISTLGIISLIILLVSVGAVWLHFKVLKQRGALDDSLAVLDVLLRDRLDIFFEITDTCPEADALYELCEISFAAPTRQVLEVLPELDRFAGLYISMQKEALAANIEEIKRAVEAYNDILLRYNAFIAAFPWRLVAHVLGLEEENMLP